MARATAPATGQGSREYSGATIRVRAERQQKRKQLLSAAGPTLARARACQIAAGCGSAASSADSPATARFADDRKLN